MIVYKYRRAIYDKNGGTLWTFILSCFSDIKIMLE